jgi:hypothetical protein
MALNLTARLGLDGSGFNTGVQKAKAKAKGLKSYVSKEMLAAGAAFAGAFAIGQLSSQVSKTIEWGTRIRDLGLQFGVSTGFVQKMDYAFKQTGTDAEVAFKSIRKMAINASIAMNPLTSAMTAQVKLDAFKKLGISADQLKSMGSEQMFMAIAKHLRDANFASGDLHDALNVVFGKAGSQLLVSFGNDLEAMSERMEALGLVDDSAIQRLGMIGDRLEEFKTQNRGVWADIVDAGSTLWMRLVNLVTSAIDILAERMVSLWEGITKLASAGGSVIDAVKNRSVKDLKNAAKELKEAGKSLLEGGIGKKAAKNVFEIPVKLKEGDLKGAATALGSAAYEVSPGVLMDLGERMKSKEDKTENRLKERQGQQKLDEEMKAVTAAEQERLKVAEEMAKLQESDAKRRFDSLPPIMQLISMQREVAKTRKELAALPFYSEAEIIKAIAGLDRVEAATVRADLEAANLAYSQKEAALAASRASLGKSSSGTNEVVRASQALLSIQRELSNERERLANMPMYSEDDIRRAMALASTDEERREVEQKMRAANAQRIDQLEAVKKLTEQTAEAAQNLSLATGDPRYGQQAGRDVVLAQQLLDLSQKLTAERTKLASLPFYTEADIEAAIAGLEGAEADKKLAELQAANAEFKAQSKIVEDAAKSQQTAEAAQNLSLATGDPRYGQQTGKDVVLAQQLLDLSQKLTAERTKLASLPFYTEADIEAAIAGLEGTEADKKLAELQAANAEFEAQSKNVEDAAMAQAGKRSELTANKIESFAELEPAERLLALQRLLVAERENLAAMPFYSDEQIRKATEGLTEQQAQIVEASLRAANTSRLAQEDAVAQAYSATADAKKAADESAAKTQPVELAGENKFSSLARIGGQLGGRNPILDMTKRQFDLQKQQADFARRGTQALETLAGK